MCNVLQCQKSTGLQQISQIVYIHLSGVLRIGKLMQCKVNSVIICSFVVFTVPNFALNWKMEKTDNERLYNLDTQIWGLACKLDVLYYVCARNSSRHHKNEHLCVFQTKWCWDRKRWAQIKLVFICRYGFIIHGLTCRILDISYSMSHTTRPGTVLHATAPPFARGRCPLIRWWCPSL